MSPHHVAAGVEVTRPIGGPIARSVATAEFRRALPNNLGHMPRRATRARMGGEIVAGELGGVPAFHGLGKRRTKTQKTNFRV